MTLSIKIARNSTTFKSMLIKSSFDLMKTFCSLLSEAYLVDLPLQLFFMQMAFRKFRLVKLVGILFYGLVYATMEMVSCF